MEHIESVLQKIKDARIKQGLSHENMAFELGISQGAYSNIEKNNTNLTVDRLIKISEILSKPIYYFFDENPNNIFNQNLESNAIGYQQHTIENLHQNNKEIYDKLESSYKDMIDLLKQENLFLRERIKKFD